MIKYSFKNIERKSGTLVVPFIDIDIKTIKNYDDEIHLVAELNNLSGEYLREIASELKEIKAGLRDGCSFGYETTTVHCGYFIGCPRIHKCVIEYDYGEKSIEVDFEDMCKMMIDWRDYVDAWEKETGGVKR